MKWRIFVSALLGLLSTLFVACKHEPETATPPVITINPALIMQTFSGTITFYGTASGVRNDLQVTIKDFASEPTITANEYSFATSVENGRWSFTIDTVNGTTCTDGRTVQLADGCYELTVTAIATSTVLGVSGMYVFAKAPFVVENTQNGNDEPTSNEPDTTAPVILVTSSDEKASSLNYDIQIEGKVYDEGEIDNITVTIFDTNGNKKISKTAHLISSSEWKVIFDREDDFHFDSFSPILANDNYTYTVSATDKAGNSNAYFFHKADVYTQFAGNKLNISEWAAFDKGSTDNVSGQVLDREWFESIRIPTNISVTYNDRPTLNYSNGVKVISNSDVEISIYYGNTINPFSIKIDSVECYVWHSGKGNEYTQEDKISQENIVCTYSFVRIKNAPVFTGGHYYIYLTFFDNQNNRYDFLRTCFIDKPCITINVPIEPFSTTDPDFAFSGTATTSTGETGCRLDYKLTKTDKNGNVETIFGKILPVGNETSWNGDWTLDIPDEDGVYEYEFTAISGEKSSSITRTVTLDTTPKLTTNVSTSTFITNDTHFSLSGKALTSTGRTGCRLDYRLTKTDTNGNSEEINGRILPVGNVSTWNGDWTLDIPDEDGVYKYVLTATSGENRISITRTITLDTTPPYIEISSITQNEAGTAVSINGCTNDLNGVKKLEYCLIPKNQMPLENDWDTYSGSINNEWSITKSALSLEEGDYSFYVRVTDNAGNTKETHEGGDLSLDKYTPVLTVNVENNNWNWHEIKTISGTATDTHFKCLKVKVDENEAVEIPVSNGFWEWTPTEISNGEHTVLFIAEDTSGKTKKETRNIIFDN